MGSLNAQQAVLALKLAKQGCEEIKTKDV